MWASPVVTLVLGVWLAGRIDGAEAWALLRNAHPGWFAAAVVLGPIQVAVIAERWRRSVVQLGLPLGRREAVSEYALSHLLNQILPGGVAGDAVRIWRQRAPARPIGAVVQAAFAERILGLGVLCLFVIGGLLAWPVLHPSIDRPAGALWLTGALVGAIAAASLTPAYVPGIGAPAAGLRRAVLVSDIFVGQTALSIVLVALFLAGFALCGRALGEPLGWAVLTTIPLVLLAMTVPLSVGGWGLREATALTLLPALGWSEEAAVAVSAAYGLSAAAGALPGLLVPLFPRKPPPSECPGNIHLDPEGSTLG